MSFEYTTALDVGARKRELGGINEDSVCVGLVEKGHLDVTRTSAAFALADGAGGEEAGEVASRAAATVAGRRLTELLWDLHGTSPLKENGADEEGEPDLTERINEGLIDTVLSAHQRVLERVNELDLSGAFTTIVAGVKFADRLYYGWVGDSRAYVINLHPERDPARSLSLLTKDHSHVQRLLDRGEIDEIEAQVHREGNRVTRALGGTASEDPSTSTVQVDTGNVRLFGDDVVLLTSDGLVDAYADAPLLHEEYRQANDPTEIREEILEHAVTDDEISEVIRDAATLEDAADLLVHLANDRGGKDNLSLILGRDRGLDRSPSSGLPERGFETAGESPADAPTTLRRHDV